MEFRSLKKQYLSNKDKIASSIATVIEEANFISGHQVQELEGVLADYVGVKHCITCANGTDALQLALMAWGIKEGDAVFVPDFTFFSSGEVVSAVGATPVFVDVEYDTCNIDPRKLEIAIEKVIKEGKIIPRAFIAVDLFGQPANYAWLRKIAEKYNVLILEDGAQGFGGAIDEKKACSFGDIATTSFFPMKPLGCYGDGGAIFTDNDEWAELIKSYRVHGKGTMKYDNVRIGMNSRLDTLQAAILLAKFDIFVNEEIGKVNDMAKRYTDEFKKYSNLDIKLPFIMDRYLSSWAQYTIKLNSKGTRDKLQLFLKEHKIPSFVYYPKPMHMQEAFADLSDISIGQNYDNSTMLADRVLSLPLSPYMEIDEMEAVVDAVINFFNS